MKYKYLTVTFLLFVFITSLSCQNKYERTFYNFKKALDFNAAIFIEADSTDGPSAGNFGDIVIQNLNSRKKFYLNSDTYYDGNPILSSDRKGIYFFSKRTGSTFSRKIAGLSWPSGIYYLSLLDKSIRQLPISDSSEGLPPPTCMATMPNDTALVICTVTGILTYSMKSAKFQNFNAKPADYDLGDEVGITSDAKYFYVNYSVPFDVPHREKAYVTRLGDTTNILSFIDYTWRYAKVIGYNQKKDEFYLAYYPFDTTYKDLNREIYKFNVRTKKTTLLFRFDDITKEMMLPKFMPNEELVYGYIRKQPPEFGLQLFCCNLKSKTINYYPFDDKIRTTDYSFFWK